MRREGITQTNRNEPRNMSKSRILVTGTTLPIVEELLSPFGEVEVTRNTDERSLIGLMKGTIAVIARGMKL